MTRAKIDLCIIHFSCAVDVHLITDIVLLSSSVLCVTTHDVFFTL